MKSEIAQRLESMMTKDIDIFVDKYAQLSALVDQILTEKGLTQKDLAGQMGKSQSEISKWLSGHHNLTLKSIAKLEAQLGETLVVIPTRRSTDSFKGKVCTIHWATNATVNLSFNPSEISNNWKRVEFPKTA